VILVTVEYLGVSVVQRWIRLTGGQNVGWEDL
jgi:hypothetical protein